MTQKERILVKLTEAGRVGMPTVELFDGLFCCNYKARISDLRKDGHNIVCFPIKGSAQHRYFIFKGTTGAELALETEAAREATDKYKAVWSTGAEQVYAFEKGGQGQLLGAQ
jgi:hypothetical protein